MAEKNETVPLCYGFIPARYASTRFPAKALTDILGKPMFWHAWSRACRCPMLHSVTLCTDDTRIADVAASLNVPCIMTRTDHDSGSDRVHEAACAMGLAPDDVVVNIQGDEPALVPAMLDDLLRPFADPTVHAATLAHAISSDEAASPDRVKVVVDTQSNALYFSRACIPYPRDAADSPDSAALVPYLLHVGLYAFRMKTLSQFTSLAPSPLEQREKLEQLRFLENGIPIRVSLTRYRSMGVDRPEDIPAVVAALTGQS